MEIIFLFIFILSILLINLHITISERRLINLEIDCIYNNIKMMREILEIKNAKDCIVLLDAIETNINVLIKNKKKRKSVITFICDALTAYQNRFYHMIQFEKKSSEDDFIKDAYKMLKELEKEIIRITQK